MGTKKNGQSDADVILHDTLCFRIHSEGECATAGCVLINFL